MMARVWRCRKVTKGVRCDTENARVKQVCTRCGGPRPKRRKPSHRAVLDMMPYEAWEARYGASCGICGATPKEGQKRLQRDHAHGGPNAGQPRGLLCFRCNTALRDYMTLEWMRKAVAYLERAEADACSYCGQTEGHSLRCSVTKFDAPEHRMPAA